jgi:VWFA-related protein
MKASLPISISSWILFFTLPAIAQQGVPLPSTPPPESPLTTSPAAQDHRITLNVVVNDRSGKPVSGLQEQDFTLLDNKQPQKLLSFRAIDLTSQVPPPEVILLIDAVNTSFLTVSYERSQIVKFLGQNGGKLAQPVSIIFFTDTNTQVQTAPTSDGNTLIAAFDKNVTGLRTINRAQGLYGAVDRLDLSLRNLAQLSTYEASKPGRKMVIWISPGWPILTGPRIELSNHQQEQLFSGVVSMSTTLRRANITLYSVDPLGTNDAGSLRSVYYEEFLKGVKSVNKVQAGNLALQVLAVQSGGQALRASNDITALLNRCTEDATAYYELSFDPPPADGPNDYRSLEVKIGKPGLTARTRTGYYAQP